MKKHFTRLSLFMVLCLHFTCSNAQQSVASAGGDVVNETGSVSYTVGQTVYSTNVAESGSVAEGVQQAYEISEVTGIENQDILLSMLVYPNPVVDFLELQIDSPIDDVGYNYQLFDVNGNLIESKDKLESKTKIDMSGHTHGTYLLKIVTGTKISKTYKIIKN